MQWLVYLDRQRRLTWMAAQEPGVRARFGLSHADTDAMAWAIDSASRRFPGAAGVMRALAVALGLPMVYGFYLLPGVKLIADRVYHWVTLNRHSLPGVTPYCSRGHACPEP